MIIDGKKIAAELREELKKKVADLKSTYNAVPGLTVILVGEDMPSKIYVKNKEKSAIEVGINSEVIRYPANLEEKALLDKIKELNKNNTFEDYISSAKFLIHKKYTSKGKIIGMGGSAGGLLMGTVVNQAPELFLGIIMAVPFVDTLTTNLNHSLPLTVGEFNEFGNAKENKKHFDYIRSYSPYENIKKMDYPHIFITTSLSDNRVLFDEPTKFTAKLRDYKTDNNLLLLKTEMKAGHAGKTGRDSAIEEIALDYAFALKISGKLNS